MLGRPRLALACLQQQTFHDLAANFGDVAFERSNTCLARVIARDVTQSRFCDVQLVLLQPVVLHLLGNEVLLRDRDLLVLRVAREPDHLHAIEQRRRNIQGVRRGNEHHVGQVVLDLDVVIDEGRVLLGVEHLQQRRRRVAAKVHSHLVDFVEQEQRISDADLGHVLQDLARHRADVSAAVAADLGLVAHATQAHAHELAVGRARDRLAKRGLAHARCADEAKDRSLQSFDALLHREILDDALFDFLQAIVVGVEHLDRVGQILVDLALLLPWQTEERVDEIAHDGRFGRHRRHHLELLQLAHGLGLGLLRHLGGLDLLFHLVEISVLVALA